jgi:hypothetical protein
MRSVCRNHNPYRSCPRSRVCNKSSMTGATSGARTAYHYGPLSSLKGFDVVRVGRSLVFCVVLCRSLFLCHFWWLHCLSCFDPAIFKFHRVADSWIISDVCKLDRIENKPTRCLKQWISFRNEFDNYTGSDLLGVILQFGVVSLVRQSLVWKSSVWQLLFRQSLFRHLVKKENVHWQPDIKHIHANDQSCECVNILLDYLLYIMTVSIFTFDFSLAVSLYYDQKYTQSWTFLKLSVIWLGHVILILRQAVPKIWPYSLAMHAYWRSKIKLFRWINWFLAA